MAGPKNNKICSLSFQRYYALRKFPLIINSELESNKDLLEKLGGNKDVFIRWASLERMDFEAGISQEVDDFLNGKFGNNKVRSYSLNVKEWKRKSKVVFKRDNYTCAYCSQVGGILEVDHIIAFSKGGDDDLSNLTTSCRKCNRQKKDKTVEEFLKWKIKHGK